MHLLSASEILRSRRTRWLIAGALLIAVTILGADVVLSLQARQAVLVDAQTSLLRQTLAVSTVTDRTFQAVNLMLVNVAEKIRREASPHRDLQQFTSREIHEFLKEKVSELPQIDTLGILDANGKRMNHSRAWPGNDIDLSYREYFRELKKHSATGTFVGELIQGATTKAWKIVMARPVFSNTGEFLGVVYASIVLQYFEELLQTMTFGDGLAATLMRNDGMLLARYPTAGKIGMVTPESVLTGLGESRSSVSRLINPIDHEARIAAVYRLPNFPLVVVATQTERAAFAAWRSIVTTMSLIALVVASLITAAAFLIARSLRQQDQLNEERKSRALSEAEMKRQRDLATQAVLFNAAAENMPQGLDMFDASERLIVCNDHYREMYGYTCDQTRQGATLQSILEARVAGRLSPEDAAAYVEQRLRKVREGKPYDVEEKLPDGRIIAISRRILPVGGCVAVHQDITERKFAEQRQGRLVSELDHRVKNVLARVATVARYSREGNCSIDEFLRALDGRIQSMADAHALLSQSHWRGVSLADLVRRQLAPYTTGTNIVVSGPAMTLSAVSTQALAMVLQELVTNAVKYGSLSTPNGKVSVNWERRAGADGAMCVVIVWRETGGPSTKAPSHYSYGTNLIRNLIPHELGGSVDLLFAPEGLRCDIEIPLEAQLAH